MHSLVASYAESNATSNVTFDAMFDAAIGKNSSPSPKLTLAYNFGSTTPQEPLQPDQL